MEWFARPREEAIVRDVLRADRSGLLVVSGRPGVGRSRLVARALAGTRALHFPAPAMGDADNRGLFRRALSQLGVDPLPDPTAGWPELLGVLPSPSTVVLDDADLLVRANRKLAAHVADVWRGRRAGGEVLRVGLVVRDLDQAESWLERDSPFRDPRETYRPGPPSRPGVHLHLRPLTYRSMGELAPEWTPARRQLGYALFGGVPAVLACVDPDRSPEDSFVDAVLSGNGRLHDRPLDQLTGLVQSPARYASLLRALAEGARQWRELTARIPEAASGTALAPYLSRLRALGLVAERTSLDARPNSRRRHYGLTDPFDALWWRHVLPVRGELARETASPWHVWSRFLGDLTWHRRQVLLRSVRSFLAAGVDRLLGANAREVGGLWDRDSEIPLAATLRNGAIVYGDVHAGDLPMPRETLDRLDTRIRKTRYGFGREARIRLLVSESGFDAELRQSGRSDPLLRLLNLDEVHELESEPA